MTTLAQPSTSKPPMQSSRKKRERMDAENSNAPFVPTTTSSNTVKGRKGDKLNKSTHNQDISTKRDNSRLPDRSSSRLAPSHASVNASAELSNASTPPPSNKAQHSPAWTAQPGALKRPSTSLERQPRRHKDHNNPSLPLLSTGSTSAVVRPGDSGGFGESRSSKSDKVSEKSSASSLSPRGHPIDPGQPHDAATGTGARFGRDDQSSSSRSKSSQDSPRKKQIISLLSHRRLILERMKQCHAASEFQLGLIASEKLRIKGLGDVPHEGTDGTNSKGKKSEKAGESHEAYSRNSFGDVAKLAAGRSGTAGGVKGTKYHPSCQKGDDEGKNEIDEFRKLTRKAMQPMKRQRSDAGGIGESARGSISLRRGASVGKKMTAAVASLTNMGLCVSDSSSAASGAVAYNAPLHAHPKNGTSISPVPGLSVQGHSSGSGVPGISSTAVPSSVAPNHTNATAPKKAIQSLASSPATIGGAGVAPSTQSHHSQISSVQPRKGASPHRQPPSLVNSAASKASRSASVSQISSRQAGRSPTNVGGSQKIKRSGSQKNAKMANQMGVVGNLSPPDIYPSSSSAFLYGSSAHANRQAKQNLVFFPEAIALRERRNGLIAKLGSLILERQKRTDGREAVLEIGKPPGLSTVSSAPSVGKATPPTWASVMAQQRGPQPPMRLPPRRKTHWDYVLEEMRWLATDFVEERKWKVACSRTISSAVRSHGRCSSTPPFTAKEQTPASSEVLSCTDADKGVAHDSETDTVAKLSTEDKNSNRPIETAGSTNLETEQEPWYERPTHSDEKCTRTISKLLSVIVTEHWDTILGNGAFPPTDSGFIAGYRRCRKLQKTHWSDALSCLHADGALHSNTGENCESTKITAIASPKKIHSIGRSASDESKRSASPTRENSVSLTSAKMKSEKSPLAQTNRIKALSHGQITERIQSSVDKAYSAMENCSTKESSEVNIRRAKRQTKDCGVDLNSKQMDAVRFVEQMWSDSDDKEKPGDCIISGAGGAILDGVTACGKTITVCAIIWKHRMDGPHLVVCPAASVIRWRHELRRFRDLNVLTYGHLGASLDFEQFNLASSASHSIFFRARDVIICELSCLPNFLNDQCTRVKTREGTSSTKSARGIVSFSTITLDARYPVQTPLSSLSLATASTASSPSTKKRRRQTSLQHVTNSCAKTAPPELLSLAWWAGLLNAVASSNIKRLLVESGGFALQQRRLDRTSIVNAEDKNGIDLLAMMAAFIHHPSTFYSKRSSITKKVLSWAKRRYNFLAKNLAESDMEGSEPSKNAGQVSSPPGVSSILSEILEPFRFDQSKEEFYGLDGTGAGNVAGHEKVSEFNIPFHWEYKLCPLPASQRCAYDKCCSYVRGALSSSARENPTNGEHRSKETRASWQADRIAADALLRLRRACIHSHVRRVLSDNMTMAWTHVSKSSLQGPQKPPEKSALASLGTESSIKGCTGSPSQPNVELASQILQDSTKMRELLSILIFKCGHSIAGGSSLSPYLRREPGAEDLNASQQGAMKRKKIVILATLPDAQLLTSLLLNSVGIAHELLLSSNIDSQSGTKSTEGNDNHRDVMNSLIHYAAGASAWMESQHALSRFEAAKRVETKVTQCPPNSKKGRKFSAESKSFFVDVIVSSPITIGSNNGGLCTTSADFIVSLDEDWSGRGKLFMESILFNYMARHRNAKAASKEEKKKCSFIKLICDDTCEKSFLVGPKDHLEGSCAEVNQATTETTRSGDNVPGSMVVKSSIGRDRNSRSTPSRKNSEHRVKRRKKRTSMKPSMEKESLSRKHEYITDVHGFLAGSKCLTSLSSPSRATRQPGCEENVTSTFPNRAVLGASILKLRNIDLSRVLCTSKHLPPDFSTGLDMLFLPTQIRKNGESVRMPRANGESDKEGKVADMKGQGLEQDNQKNGKTDLSSDSLTIERNAGIGIDIAFGTALVQAEAEACPLSNPVGLISALSTTDQHDFSFMQAGVDDVFSFITLFKTVVPPLPPNFPPKIMTRRDACSIPSRVYIERFGKVVQWYRVASVFDSAHTLSQEQGEQSATSTPPIAGGAAGIELADAWHQGGLSRKPGDAAASLLVYNLPRLDDSFHRRNKETPVSAGSSSPEMNGLAGNSDRGSSNEMDEAHSPLKRKRRSRSTSHATSELEPQDTSMQPFAEDKAKRLCTRKNSYSFSYTTARNARSNIIIDGNQGCEPLVYFPPLFPCLLQSVQQATKDVQNMASSSAASSDASTEKGVHASNMDATAKKRKDYLTVPAATLSSGKRPRIAAPATSSATSVGVALPLAAAHPVISESSSPFVPSLPSASETGQGLVNGATTPHSRSNTTNAVLSASFHANDALSAAASEDFAGIDNAVTAAAATIVTEDESSSGDAVPVVVDLDDDYGLLGFGALPLSRDSADQASRTSIETSSYAYWKDQYDPCPFDSDSFTTLGACDAEEYNKSSSSSFSNLVLDAMLLIVKKGTGTLAGARGNVAVSSFSSHYNNVTDTIPPGFGGPGSSCSSSLFALMSATSSSSAAGMGNGSYGTNTLVPRGNEKGTKKSSSSKKTKKVQQGSFSPLMSADFNAPSRTINHLSAAAVPSSSKAKDFGMIVRATTARAGGLQPEPARFRLAVVRLRHRVANRVSYTFLTSSGLPGPGPGFPLSLMNDNVTAAHSQQMREVGSRKSTIEKSSKQHRLWTTAFTKLSVSGSKTGDNARAISTSQRASLRRSIVAPCRVDFGPFQVGYLSSPRGMTGTPPKSRVGISLPMGVKTPLHKAQQQRSDSSMEPWKAWEDKKLTDCAKRYGFNWHVASDSVTGTGTVRESVMNATFIRSAKQCRERWQHNSKIEPSLFKDFSRSEHNLRKMANTAPFEIPKSLGNTVLLGQGAAMPSLLQKAPFGDHTQDASNRESGSGRTLSINDGSSETSKQATMRPAAKPPQATISDAVAVSTESTAGANQKDQQRRFGFLKVAALKSQNVPMTIPGVASGTNPASLPVVPSHMSHAQSVQAAIAASSTTTGGAPPRVEMWPLQLLDLADKQHAAALAGTATVQGQVPVTSSSSSNSSSNNRQQRSGGVATAPAQPQHQQQPAPYHQMQQQQHVHQTQMAQPPVQVPPTPQTQHRQVSSSQQQELVKQAARAAALSSPSARATPQQHHPPTVLQQQQPMAPTQPISAPSNVSYSNTTPPVVPVTMPPVPSSSATPEVKAAALAAALGHSPSQQANPPPAASQQQGQAPTVPNRRPPS